MEQLIGWSAFVMILALWSMLVVWIWMRRSSRQTELHQRLGIAALPDESSRTLQLWRDGRAVSLTVPTERVRHTLTQYVDGLHRRTGWRVPMTTVLLGLAACMLLAFAAGLLWTHQVLLALLGPLAILPAFWIWVKRSIAVHAAAFDRQLLDALDLVVRSLRANHPLLGAMQLVSQEIPSPVGTLFGEVCQQQGLGMSLEESLRKTAASTDHAEFKLFATSISIQMRSGGHLADMVTRLAHVIRDRIRLGRRVRVLTAQVQLSKRILVVLPFILFLTLNVVSPDYVRVLYTTATGRLLLMGAGIALTLGALLMNRMARLQY
jgi:tight adherence protein B